LPVGAFGSVAAVHDLTVEQRILKMQSALHGVLELRDAFKKSRE